jgi:hypothetical protein
MAALTLAAFPSATVLILLNLSTAAILLQLFEIDSEDSSRVFQTLLVALTVLVFSNYAS